MCNVYGFFNNFVYVFDMYRFVGSLWLYIHFLVVFVVVVRQFSWLLFLLRNKLRELESEKCTEIRKTATRNTKFDINILCCCFQKVSLPAGNFQRLTEN